MGAMNVCSCGWTIVSPLGAEDCVKHTMIHLRDAHPGTIMTHDEILAHTKPV
jgi:predicted small metal-binding protein